MTKKGLIVLRVPESFIGFDPVSLGKRVYKP